MPRIYDLGSTIIQDGYNTSAFRRGISGPIFDPRSVTAHDLSLVDNKATGKTVQTPLSIAQPVWGIRQQGDIEIDWENPLTRGLSSFIDFRRYFLALDYRRDLADPTVFVYHIGGSRYRLKYEMGVKFNGSGNYIASNHGGIKQINFSTGGFTVAINFKSPSAITTQQVIYSQKLDDDNWFRIYNWANSIIYCGWENANFFDGVSSTTGANKEHFLVFTAWYDPGASFYKSRLMMSNSSIGFYNSGNMSVPPTTLPEFYYIGSNVGSSDFADFAGAMSYCAVWNRPFSEGEVKSLAQNRWQIIKLKDVRVPRPILIKPKTAAPVPKRVTAHTESLKFDRRPSTSIQLAIADEFKSATAQAIVVNQPGHIIDIVTSLPVTINASMSYTRITSGGGLALTPTVSGNIDLQLPVVHNFYGCVMHFYNLNEINSSSVSQQVIRLDSAETVLECLSWGSSTSLITGEVLTMLDYFTEAGRTGVVSPFVVPANTRNTLVIYWTAGGYRFAFNGQTLQTVDGSSGGCTLLDNCDMHGLRLRRSVSEQFQLISYGSFHSEITPQAALKLSANPWRLFKEAGRSVYLAPRQYPAGKAVAFPERK